MLKGRSGPVAHVLHGDCCGWGVSHMAVLASLKLLLDNGVRASPAPDCWVLMSLDGPDGPHLGLQEPISAQLGALLPP